MDGARANDGSFWLIRRAHAWDDASRVCHWTVAALFLAVAGALTVTVGGEALASSAYLGLGVALVVGSLITVPWRADGSPSSLLVVALIPAYWRLGPAAAPLLLIATVVANATRGASLAASGVAALADLAAFAVACAVAAAMPEPRVRTAAFVVAFAVLRTTLGWALGKTNAPTRDRHVAQPDLLLWATLAPLGAAPILVGEVLGDGGVLLALAGVLPVLCVVGEWWRLRVARAEAEAERTRLEHARTVQEELTHLMTHEVRTPLTTVLGYCQMARAALEGQSSQPDDLMKHLDRIYRAGRNIERLMENLLELAKVEGVGEEAANEPVNLGDVVRDVAAGIEPIAEQKMQRLVLDVPDIAPVAWASPILLREALSNLASNAVKYTPQGGTVRIWASEGPEPGRSTVGVSDTGVGLSESDRKRLFTKFFRSDDSRVARERGSGLGLALTHAIVQRMGGDIAVESELNEGATFRVSLPSAARGS